MTISYYTLTDPVGQFKSFVMNNKAFLNIFCNPQKSFHNSPTRIKEAVNHSSSSTVAFTKKKLHLAVIFFLVNAIVEFEEWLTTSIIRVGRFRRGVKFFFVDYRMNYQKLCYLMRQITKDLKSASEWKAVAAGFVNWYLQKSIS